MSGLFKAYDIRGIYGPEINEKFAERLAFALIKYIKPKNVVIGYDSRHGNVQLFSAIAKVMLDNGVEVIHIGLVSRPMLNWVVFKHEYDMGIAITASHNPREFNGFKIVKKGAIPMDYDTGLSDVEKLMNNSTAKKAVKNKKRRTSNKLQVVSRDFINEYVDFLSSHLSKDAKKALAKNELRLVADATNGSAGEIIKRLMERNNIDYELLFGDPDGNFPCHNTNPLDNNALIVLGSTVSKNKANFGFIVDPDADRIRFVDEKGSVIDNNYAACAVTKYLLNKHPKAVIVHDLVCRKVLGETIRRNSGKEISSKVGFSNISHAMREHKGIFGVEISGHYAFKDMNYLDSGLFMLIQFINMWSASSGKRISTIIKSYDRYIDIGEKNYKLTPIADKSAILRNILKYYKDNKKKLKVRKILTLDGVSVYFKDSWFNVRPSNTEPLMRLRAEGRKEKDLTRLQKTLEKLILS